MSQPSRSPPPPAPAKMTADQARDVFTSQLLPMRDKATRELTAADSDDRKRVAQVKLQKVHDTIIAWVQAYPALRTVYANASPPPVVPAGGGPAASTRAAAAAAAAAIAAASSSSSASTMPPPPPLSSSQPGAPMQYYGTGYGTRPTPYMPGAAPFGTAMYSASAAAASLASAGTGDLVSRQKLSELVSQIDPAQRCEQDVANLLLELADEFVASTTRFACDLAKHRSSSTVEVKDLQLYIESHYQLRVPGLFSGAAPESLEPAMGGRQRKQGSGPVHAHSLRLAHVKRAVHDEQKRRKSSAGAAAAES